MNLACGPVVLPDGLSMGCLEKIESGGFVIHMELDLFADFSCLLTKVRKFIFDLKFTFISAKK